MTDTITREQALKLADEAVAALKGWRHESECPPDEVHAICNAAIKYYIDQQAALAAPQPTIPSDKDVIENLMTALQWYADGNHFSKADPGAWDTVSGEPQNWWCDEAGTAMVEDGSLAAMVLQGRLTGAQLQAIEDGEIVEPPPEPQPKGLFVDMIAEHGLQEPQPVKQADQSCRNCTFHYKDVDMPPCNSCTLGDHVNNNWEPMSAGQRQLNRLPPEGATQ